MQFNGEHANQVQTSFKVGDLLHLLLTARAIDSKQTCGNIHPPYEYRGVVS